MARAQKLKVFRTAIGFHDAYVAAPSRAAALRAWGSDKDLFARGVAELVTDPALVAEPLAAPGTVIRRLRGTAAEQLAALPPDKARAVPKAKAAPKSARPSRAALDAAERAIAEADERGESARRELTAREAAIARERRAFEAARAKESAQLDKARAEAATAFDRAMRRWRA